jgi:excisionase family DNA binding protein
MKLLMAGEMAALLRCPMNRVYELAARNVIPHVHIGRQLRFPEAKVLAWLEAGGTPLDADSDASINVVAIAHRT